MKNHKLTYLFGLSIFLLFACDTTKKVMQDAKEVMPAKEESMKVYILDGGFMDLNLDFFSIDTSYVNEREQINNPVIIIEHPKGRMIWDSGLPDAFADLTEEQAANMSPVGTFMLKEKLIDQLAKINLTPDSFDYVSFSHTHVDHAGNGNYFVNSNWLVRQAELEYAFSDDEAVHQSLPFYQQLKDAKKTIITGEYDVFGDGKVVIHPFPGHTPGHSTLYLDLEDRQDVMFTGDLFHFQRQRVYQRMPVFNSDFVQTAKSMKAFEEKVKEMNVEVFIQHDKEHFKKLPKYPNYWK